MFILCLATTFIVVGVGLLYLSWRSLIENTITVPLAWLSLALGLWLWTKGAGLEFGLSYAFLLIGFVAWLAVSVNYKIRRHSKTKENSYIQLELPKTHTIVQHGVIFLLAVPISGMMAIFLSVVISMALPFSQLSALVFSVLLMPLIWGLGSFWVCASTKLWKPAVSMIGLIVLCAGLIFG